MWPLNEYENLHFDNYYDTYMSSKLYDYGHDLNLVIVSL